MALRTDYLRAFEERRQARREPCQLTGDEHDLDVGQNSLRMGYLCSFEGRRKMGTEPCQLTGDEHDLDVGQNWAEKILMVAQDYTRRMI
jgi:hypothetical protein